MPLPDSFQFSQNNLQDYVDCPRRFQLRHLLHQEWPAAQTDSTQESNRLIEIGSKFHQYVYQHHAGVSGAQIADSISDSELKQLWQNYIDLGPSNKFETRKVEFSLVIPFAGFRLLAKYDFLIFEPQGKRLIYDWKTSRKQPKREFMQQRLQTRIYPYILTQAQYPANEKPAAEDIQMIYWYPNFPKLPISFQYNKTQQIADEQYLLSLVDEIQKQNEPFFPLTLDLKQCKFCVYRSLCERGDKPGSFSELEELDGLTTDIRSDWDFESIPEITF